jgi:cysteine desulfurase
VVDRHRAHGDLGRSVAGAYVGHEGLDDEDARRRQQRSDTPEQLRLVVFAEEIEDRVVGDQDRIEGSVGERIGHVAEDRLDPPLAVAFAQPGEHRCAGVDTDDPKAGGCHGDGEPAGADAEFEHAAIGAGEFEHASNGGVDVGDVGVPVVVDIGEPVAVRTMVVSPHAPEVMPDRLHRGSDPDVIGSVEWVTSAITYLDHAASTPMRAEAVEAMAPYFSELYANPSGSHRFARRARQAVDEARDTVARVVGCHPNEVVFTGCGTESDNMAITGAIARRGGVAVCPAVEHHAVLHVVEHLADRGRVVGVDAFGRVDLDQLAATLDATTDVSIVSVMAVNNEVGTITDLAEVARVVRRHAPGALLHTDAVQSACWLDLRDVTPHVDLLSLSAHKFGGPKGVGVLVERGGPKVDPLIIGGGQERERRSGTHNTAGIVAAAVALDLTDRERAGENVRLAALRDTLVTGLQDRLDGVTETVPPDHKVAGSAHVCIAGIESEALLFLLDEADVCASAASACASGAMEPSHVLAAMGVDRSVAIGAVRLTLGHTTTADDIERAVDVIGRSVDHLRRKTIASAS